MRKQGGSRGASSQVLFPTLSELSHESQQPPRALPYFGIAALVVLAASRGRLFFAPLLRPPFARH